MVLIWAPYLTHHTIEFTMHSAGCITIVTVRISDVDFNEIRQKTKNKQKINKKKTLVHTR